MTITPQDAARALKEVEQVADRSSTLMGYRAAGPSLILWGCVWFLVNLCCDRWPHMAGLFWTFGDAIGFAGSFLLIPRTQGVGRISWRSFATLIVAMVSAAASATLLQIRSAETLTAFFTLLVGSVYMIWGCWRGVRIFGLGVMIVVISMVVGLSHPPHFYVWMAVNGGGALILAGFWLRRA